MGCWLTIISPHSVIKNESHIEGRKRFKKTLEGTWQAITVRVESDHYTSKPDLKN
jgi:hypothetical protein